jgi:hypothetical protein
MHPYTVHHPSCMLHDNDSYRCPEAIHKLSISSMLSHGNGIFLAALLLLTSSCAFAGETLDKIRFDAPGEFTAERGADHIGFTQTDQQEKTYCQIAVYSSRPASGTMEQEFFTDWQQILSGAHFDNTPSMKNGTTSSGIPYMTGEQDVEANGFKYYSRLYTFQADKSVFSILVNAPSKDTLAKCKGAADMILGSMKLLNSVAGTASAMATAKTPVTGGSAGANSPRGSGISGVWMGIYMPITGMPITGSHIQERYLSFYGDGVLYSDIPRMGFAGADRETLRNDPNIKDYWGTWSASGSRGEARKPAVTHPFNIKLVSKDEIEYDSTHYYRCASVDGLKLNGAWTTFSDPADPALSAPGMHPVLHFQQDGRFRDDGLWATVLGIGLDDKMKSPGAGRYEIKDYTLILHYDDGRVRYSALTMFVKGKAEPSPKLLYIERFGMHRMP